ncbi:3alpha(or 20beta)-hydroxysteroid dehydrogenase [Isoptericola sp. CG 20/1183]|uniref:3alpha(Or 20beta)-hydroxysteroid dehydrogenase n=1 Tax=Isoptericola halotolerans TaxID=300560 RepID=A0ABX5EAT2_9MICO|nr:MULTISPECIES: glucose 1-dehydrogenase [Isoptericola]PRZ02763.1 3alpha(or 20beta)-hydroxysteroid dehydrogenase [Isoptericola sp. CG 20/1183]PRZ03157.1 3alpha(or 20beta)-hydroxysteroid dehydrogenase [Isoptericola halotolerans]
MTTDLTDRVAIVTGGARGIGAAYVRALHDAGARVLVADLLEADGSALAHELGDRARFAHLDVTDEAGWTRVVDDTVAAWGGVDVLVNNAGIANAGPIEHYPRTKWDAVIAVNLTGTYLGCRAVVPAMKTAGRGSIINVSSVEGMRGSTHLHGYVASKFGVRGLTKSLAVELGADGIRVNSVHPGFIDTEMTAKIDPSGLPIPLRRGGRPEDLTGTVLYLAGEGSAYVTGAEIVVDGGMINGVGHL